MTPDRKYSEILKEQLELSGVQLSEAEPEEDDFSSMPMPDVGKEDEEPKKGKKEDDKKDDKKDDKEEKKDPESELADSWEIDVGTAGKIKFDMHQNYMYIWYRNRRSDKIMMPSKLRPYAKQVSELFNSLLDHVEKVS
jgi:hypothetical protein